jgi:hypothetical protein
MFSIYNNVQRLGGRDWYWILQSLLTPEAFVFTAIEVQALSTDLNKDLPHPP